MTIEAIRCLSGSVFAENFLTVLACAKTIAAKGRARDWLADDLARQIADFRRRAVADGTTATQFPSLDLVEKICVQEGFDVIRARAEGSVL
ncbi:hypothetical protein [Acidomonas methanolica]|uniref:Uncharacterized protein n=1 Tax=Acidomonas methanolica NBRC 104435 TaxID=1231351 RepID=A0A023D6L9_ACIMT|nr:hypothetical protein [Acidomonas methanolica]TCS24128.1 hypothetical protein EDC31_12549 [Acidomonas methanolica]GAJ29719.1 hypothetical protein Amme_076_012 [Acidomonas methanolica NBRC 104435]GBQ59496.1 hypothetical protein AA0498_2769 [Acidomonas methanolica]GEL00043.1 hypothetical protein AME01nite_25410 [Acidomonas methanolica NBRC 104435]